MRGSGLAKSEPVVSVRGLVKRYGSHEAVAGIELEVRRGEIFAFLGPNGAGKTTTVEILEGFGQRTEGQVSVLGHAYGAHVPGRTALALVVTVVTGAASFCCLGYALTSVIRSEEAALPAATAITLPLYIISGVFVAVTALPHWLADVGEIFPVRHLANALLVAYNPHTTGLGFAGRDLLIVAAWGVAGLLIALREFSWGPLGR
jgi:energy-coupling factor transporter ATP-binding protein EcfA2